MSFKERITECKKCENYNYGFCKICNCFIPLKARGKKQSCPIDKW